MDENFFFFHLFHGKSKKKTYKEEKNFVVDVFTWNFHTQARMQNTLRDDSFLRWWKTGLKSIARENPTKKRHQKHKKFFFSVSC